MNLKIKPLNEKVKEMYQNHRKFNEGDSGLDLFIVHDEILFKSYFNFFFIDI